MATIPFHASRDIVTSDAVDSTPLELSDLINRVLDKGAVIAGSVTISVGDIDLIQLDLTVVLTAVETARSAERRRPTPLAREDAGDDVPLLRPE